MKNAILGNLNAALMSLFLIVMASDVAQAAHHGSKELKIDRDRKTKVVLNGYDAVAYFTEMKATKGNDEYTAEWMGSVWKFANEKHKTLFLANPSKYVPAYGGRCAVSIRSGRAEIANPACFVVEADRLFLLAGTPQIDTFKADIASFISEGDNKWSDLQEEINFRGGKRK